MYNKVEDVVLRFLYVTPNSSQSQIDEYLAAGPETSSSAKWRLATAEEAESFEKQFGSKPTAFDLELPQVAAHMKRLVVARYNPEAK